MRTSFNTIKSKREPEYLYYKSPNHPILKILNTYKEIYAK